MLKRTASGLLVSGIVLALCAMVTTVAQAFTPNRSGTAGTASGAWLRVMPLGDSITEGGSASSRAGYRLPLWNLAADDPGYGLDFVGSANSGTVADSDHEGHYGWKIDALRARARAWTAAADPDVVLLHIGINDLNHGESAGAVGRLRILLNEIYGASPETVIILAGLIPVTGYGLGDKVKAFNDEARLLAEAVQGEGGRIRYVDMPLTLPQMKDPLHPNDDGYGVMAKVYAAAVADTVADGHIRSQRSESLVERYAYPNRDDVLATRQVKLKSGSSGIVLADCTGPAGGIGLLEVVTTRRTEPLCLRINAPGVLNLVVPGLRSIRLRYSSGSGNRSITAQTWVPTGASADVSIPLDGAVMTFNSEATSTLTRLTVNR